MQRIRHSMGNKTKGVIISGSYGELLARQKTGEQLEI